MTQGASFLTQEQWTDRLQAWAVERWGETRARALRNEIQETAQHLVTLSQYPFEMEQVPGFFIEEP
jgi:hypothetical protein